jgi:hypothetical protein
MPGVLHPSQHGVPERLVVDVSVTLRKSSKDALTLECLEPASTTASPPSSITKCVRALKLLISNRRRRMDLM